MEATIEAISVKNIRLQESPDSGKETKRAPAGEEKSGYERKRARKFAAPSRTYTLVFPIFYGSSSFPPMMSIRNRAASNLVTFVTLACLVIAISACRRNDPKPAQVPDKQTRVMSTDEASMLAPFATGTNVSEADKVWADLTKSFQPPSFPPEWQTNPPTPEELTRFEKQNAQLAGQAADKARDYYTRFPQSENSDDARKAEFALLNQAAQLGSTNWLPRLQQLEDAQLKNTELSAEERLEIRVGQVQRRVTAKSQEGEAAALTELEKEARAMQKEFPEQPEVAHLLVSAAQAWMDHGDAEKSRAIAQELVKTTQEDEVKAAAQELLKKLALVGKPLTIKFKALDGREVDLQAMKGKVVLIDFWATWCRPCMAELPNVKAVYEKYHAQGFEIVGISFDDDKAALERVLKNEKMTWPQHFDGEDAGKKWGDEYGISSIPTMWLVDKKGVLREPNARKDLARKVEQLMGEK